MMHSSNDWLADKKLCSLIPYDLALKLQAFAFGMDKSSQEIIIATLLKPQEKNKNQALLEEIIHQKYPHFSIRSKFLESKVFYDHLEKLKIQEIIHFFTHQIHHLKNPQSNINELYRFILESAILKNASDIHLESKNTHASFKIRKDGKIKEISLIESEIFELLCNKIKLEAKLDISEKRLPQDGRYSFVFQDKEYDFRISCVPTQYGESIVMRILYKQAQSISLDSLNLSPHNLNIIQKSIRSLNGIILITGPTGSGKSTTLYAILEALKTSEKKLITIEDPIEYQIHLATQIQINPEYGFGFAQALRAILRQDPDMIMVGEIRDQETLRLAIESSLTGHLVLSTIHTNDCISTIDRLLDMGIAPYLLNATLKAIISQRLVRKLCPSCKEPLKLEASPELKTSFAPKGCKECNMQGFLGREAVMETLEITPEIKTFIASSSTLQLREFLKTNHFQTLLDDTKAKFQKGIIAYEEIYQVAYE